MKRFFDRPAVGDKGTALVDWTVLLTGVVMLALSVLLAVTVKADQISVDTLDRVSAEEDWLPS